MRTLLIITLICKGLVQMDLSKKRLKFKIFITKVLTKLGFNTKYDSGYYKHRRNIFFLLLTAFLIIIGGTISIMAWNFKTTQLEKDFSQLQKSTDAKEIEISKLNSLLVAKDAKLEEKNNESIEKQNILMEKENQLNLTEHNLGLCKGEIISWKEKDTKSQDKISQIGGYIDSCNADRKALVNTLVNFVKAVCCSYDDASAGRDLRWSLQGGKIVCSGEFKINCATGVTNYQT